MYCRTKAKAKINDVPPAWLAAGSAQLGGHANADATPFRTFGRCCYTQWISAALYSLATTHLAMFLVVAASGSPSACSTCKDGTQRLHMDYSTLIVTRGDSGQLQGFTVAHLSLQRWPAAQPVHVPPLQTGRCSAPSTCVHVRLSSLSTETHGGQPLW